MDVAGALTSKRTRLWFVLVAFVTFVALVVYGAVEGSSVAFALVQVHIGVVLVVAVGFAVAVRSVGTDILALAALGYLVAGVLIGYGGLASLGVVPSHPWLGSAGDVALLVALVAYLYQREIAGTDDADED